MEYLVGVTDLYYKETKIILIKAENKTEAIMEAACSVDKGETLAGVIKKMKLNKKERMHTTKTLKTYLVDYWRISVSTPVEINQLEKL
jgi:hypothetical protein